MSAALLLQTAASHLLVIVGLGGEPALGATFHQQAAALVDAAQRRYGLSREQVTYLGEDPSRDRTRIQARATRENVERAFGQLAARSARGDFVLVVLIGHGSHDGADSRFNLPGPDLTAADYGRLLAPLDGRRVAFVNTASASGDFAKVLAGAGRVIVTATKSGFERNATVFPRYFVAALAGDGADADRDGRVTLLEAFDYTRREVDRHYEADRLLPTEHAQLEDGGGGSFARSLALGVRTGATAALDPERSALVAQVVALRGRKAQMDSTVYERELETVLLELARKTRAMRQSRTGSAP